MVVVKRYAVIDATGRCVNVILWDGVTPYEPPPGCTLVQSDTREIEPYVPPAPKVPPPMGGPF